MIPTSNCQICISELSVNTKGICTTCSYEVCGECLPKLKGCPNCRAETLKKFSDLKATQVALETLLAINRTHLAKITELQNSLTKAEAKCKSLEDRVTKIEQKPKTNEPIVKPSTRLTGIQADEIRTLYYNGIRVNSLAKQFKTSPKNIHNVLSNTTFKNPNYKSYSVSND